jgi:hypothetical protein
MLHNMLMSMVLLMQGDRRPHRRHGTVGPVLHPMVTSKLKSKCYTPCQLDRLRETFRFRHKLDRDAGGGCKKNLMVEANIQRKKKCQRFLQDSTHGCTPIQPANFVCMMSAF